MRTETYKPLLCGWLSTINVLCRW